MTTSDAESRQVGDEDEADERAVHEATSHRSLV